MSDDARLPLAQVLGAGNVTRVVYADILPPRPVDALFVDWVGNVDPAPNSIDGDTWLNTDRGW